MAKEFYDWIKLALDNKWLVIACFTGISSMGVNLGQLFESQNQEAEKIKAIREVAIGFQNAMIEIEPKEVVVKYNCNQCLNEVRRLRKEYHDD